MIARPGIASSARSMTLGLGRVDHDRRFDGHREQLDDLRHLLGFVGALGDGDADVEHVRARLHLLARDVGDRLVVVGEQQPLHLARALRVHALADEQRLRILLEVRRAHRGRGAWDFGAVLGAGGLVILWPRSGRRIYCRRVA